MYIDTNVMGRGSLWRYTDSWQNIGGFEKFKSDKYVRIHNGQEGGGCGYCYDLGMLEVAYSKGH